jgi:hypothetical protein
LNKEDTENLISAIDNLIDKSGELINMHGFDSKPDSISSQELESFQRPLSLKTAYSQGHTFVEVAGDQLMAFSRTLKEPIQTIAPFTCSRSVLESCALAIWLLNNEITVTERVKRSLSFRFEGMTQQKKLANSSRTKNGLEVIEIQTNKIIKIAQDMSFPIFRDKKDKITGVATRMPSITNLAKNILNKEHEYRLLSAVTHAHSFALIQTSFAKYGDSEDVEIVLYEKSLDPRFILYLCRLTNEVFCNAVTTLTKLHGTYHIDYDYLFEETNEKVKSYYQLLYS